MRPQFNWDLYEVVGQIPEFMALFTEKTHKLRGKVKVIGKRVNRGAGCGLEVSTEHLFYFERFN